MNFSVAAQKESLSLRASFLRITSRAIAENMKSGSFRSLYRGQGIEFSGVRDYIRGDDIRAIDWNVTARMGKPFIKLFEEERELNVFIIFDCSDSLFEDKHRKIDTAVECAALLTFASEQNKCPIGCIFFDGQIKFPLAPKFGSERTMLLVKKLDAILERNDDLGISVRGSALSEALNGAGSLLKKRSLIFIISDFRVAGYETPLARLSHKHDCVTVRITSPSDKELPPVGTISFTDSESGLRKILPTNSASFKKEWKTAEQSRSYKWRDICAKRGVFPLEVSTEHDVAETLVSFFAQTRQPL